MKETYDLSTSKETKNQQISVLNLKLKLVKSWVWLGKIQQQRK